MKHQHLFDDLQPGDKLEIHWQALGCNRVIAGKFKRLWRSNLNRWFIDLVRPHASGCWSVPTEQILEMRKIGAGEGSAKGSG